MLRPNLVHALPSEVGRKVEDILFLDASKKVRSSLSFSLYSLFPGVYSLVIRFIVVVLHLSPAVLIETGN